ncbi:hypothetical protein [Vibrio sp. YQ_11]|uniref:hypothetical protein n=1 Tax=unclassified Vibrio TaxID=2614977 RepID=UPI00370B2601
MDVLGIVTTLIVGALFTYMMCESSKKDELRKQKDQYDKLLREEYQGQHHYRLYDDDTQTCMSLTYQKLRRLEDLRALELPDDNRIPEYREMIALEDWLIDQGITTT